MKRELFVDTNVLLGLTFLSDRWYRAAQPVYENDHKIHTSELVVFEYCISPKPFTTPPEDPKEEDIDWSHDRGLVERIRNRVSKPYREYRGVIRRLPDEELTLDRVIQEFIDTFRIREQAVPQIRSEFEDEFQEKAVTRQYINQFASELIDKIINASDEMKATLSNVVEVHDSEYHVALDDKQRWVDFPEQPPDEPDLSIIVDATQVIKQNSVNTVLTGDSDILVLQSTANDYYQFDILSMDDEYSAQGQPQAN